MPTCGAIFHHMNLSKPSFSKLFANLKLLLQAPWKTTVYWRYFLGLLHIPDIYSWHASSYRHDVPCCTLCTLSHFTVTSQQNLAPLDTLNFASGLANQLFNWLDNGLDNWKFSLSICWKAPELKHGDKGWCWDGTRESFLPSDWSWDFLRFCSRRPQGWPRNPWEVCIFFFNANKSLAVQTRLLGTFWVYWSTSFFSILLIIRAYERL